MGRVEKGNSRAIMPLPLRVLLGVWMAGVAAATVLWVPPAKGFRDPEAARLIIFHVPCAMIAVVAYVISMIYAILHLSRGAPDTDAKSAASAGLGFVFTVLATVTGMVFAQVEWGRAWNWDPRETSILMLMLVYAAYFALRGAIPSRAARGRISAAYNILAGLVMPFFVFVMPRVTFSLHPTGTQLSVEYRVVLGCAMVGFLGLYVWLFRTRVHSRPGE